MGATHAVLACNSTIFLRLVLHLVWVARGNEVFLLPLSYMAMANAAAYIFIV